MRSPSEALLLPRHNEIRQPEQGALELGVSQRRQGFQRLLGVAAGGGHGILDRTVALQNVLDLLAANVREAAIVQDALDGEAIGGSAVVDGMDDRQGRRSPHHPTRSAAVPWSMEWMTDRVAFPSRR